MIRLQTNMSSQLDQRYRSENVSNFKKIQYNSNDMQNNMIYHQVEQLKAHNSKQIDHNGSPLNQWAKRNDKRIENLVTGTDGDGVKEVTDSRVSMDGEIHGLLYNRLEHDFNRVNEELERIESKFIEINFGDYEPDNTGQTDISGKLQEALNKIKHAKAGKIFIPAGDYLIDNRVIIYKNTTFEMDSNATLLRGNTNETMMNQSYDDKYYGYEGNGNIHFIGGTFDSNYEQIDKYPTKAANQINLMHAENITFDNVTFRNTISYHAIDTNGVRNMKVNNCIFEGYINLTDESMKESIQLSEYVEATIAGQGYYDGTPCRDILVTGCSFRPSDILDAPHVGVGNHLSVHNIYQNNIIVTKNTFIGCKGAGVRPYKWENVRIEDNLFENCEEGVRISSVGGVDKSANDTNGIPSERPQAGRMYFINGNIFKNYKKYGVSSYGQQYNDISAKVFNIHINNNMFDCDNNDVGEAINLNICSNVHIKDNSFNYGYRGVRHRACDALFIDKNYFNSIKTEAIYNMISQYTGYEAYCRHLHITNNLINTTGRNGIFVQYTKNYFVRFNTVTNTNQQIEDSNPRGGIYLAYAETGAVENNYLWGTDKDFAIRSVGLKNTIVFNNGGSGGVFVDGDDNTKSSVIGYFNVDTQNNIVKVDKKGEV